MIKRKTFGIRKASGSHLNAPGRKRRKKSDLAKVKAKLWELCRLITRREYGDHCYTCGKGPLTGSSYQTGHFITSSICSVELRYDLKNLAVQCFNCNIDKSGNWVVFERLLREKHGDAYVEELKARNLATKGITYPLSWFQDKIIQYQNIYESI